jgi:hypothetical protein
MKRTFACAFLGFAALTASASAAPSTPPKIGALAGLTSKTATMVCIRDDRGWHYMRGERRVTCRPARPTGRDWGWKCEGKRCGWWHRRENRWND